MEDYILFQMMLVCHNAAWFRHIGANGNLENLMFKHSITVHKIEVFFQNMLPQNGRLHSLADDASLP